MAARRMHCFKELRAAALANMAAESPRVLD